MESGIFLSLENHNPEESLEHQGPSLGWRVQGSQISKFPHSLGCTMALTYIRFLSAYIPKLRLPRSLSVQGQQSWPMLYQQGQARQKEVFP